MIPSLEIFAYNAILDFKNCKEFGLLQDRGHLSDALKAICDEYSLDILRHFEYNLHDDKLKIIYIFIEGYMHMITNPMLNNCKIDMMINATSISEEEVIAICNFLATILGASGNSEIQIIKRME